MKRILAAVALLLVPAAALAQHHGTAYGATLSVISPCTKQYAPADPVPGLRKVDFFVTTGSADARGFFIQGITLLYAFNYEDSMRAFRRAKELDPQLAMASWGIAMAAGPNINIGMTEECRQLGNAEVARAQQLATEQLPLKKITQREFDFIKAAVPRYSGAVHSDDDYKVAMGLLAAAYPDDPDVLTLYAESIMDLRPWGLYDRAARPAIETGEVVALLERAIARSKQHVGANHYYIHAVEGSTTPERALASADLLQTLVPDAGHLVHMPSHIYMRLGRYHDVTASNQAAYEADERMYGTACASIDSPACLQLYYGHYQSHNLSFFTDGRSTEGISAGAIDAASRTTAHAARFIGDQPGLEHYMATYWLTLANFHRWQAILGGSLTRAEPCAEGCPGDQGCHLANAVWHWARGMALAATGRPDDAERIEAKAYGDERGKIRGVSWGNNTPDSLFNIADNLLRARIATARGKLDSAVEALQVAVTLEDDLIYDEPPPWLYAARQSLGGALLAANRNAEAKEVFLADLDRNRNPENGRSLFGLATALQALGDPTWQDVWKRYQTAWKYADYQLKVPDLW